MFGQLTNSEIEQVLQNQTIGRLGCYGNGQVYIVPITYAYDGKYLYGHSRDGLKIQMMRQHPKVCFEIDMIEDLANWKCVVLQGEFQELMGQEARHAMNIFFKQFKSQLMGETSRLSQGISQFHENEQSSMKSIIFRIRVHEKTGRFEKAHSRASLSRG